MSEREIREALEYVLCDGEAFEGVLDTGVRAVSFGNAGLLTRDEGIVLVLDDGSEFCLTVTRRK